MPLPFLHTHPLSILLDCLPQESIVNRRHAIAGLCNLSLDSKNRDLLLDTTHTDNVALILQHCLVSTDVDTVQSAMTCLSNLSTPKNKNGKHKHCKDAPFHMMSDPRQPTMLNSFPFLTFPTLEIQARYPQIRSLMETLATAKNPVTANLAKVYLLEHP